MPLAGSIAPFVVSSPFRGLRVVPCKLYFGAFQKTLPIIVLLASFEMGYFQYNTDTEFNQQFFSILVFILVLGVIL